MGRTVKHLGARSAPEDASVVLLAVPTFPGEKISRINLSCYLASGADSAIDQTGECNWYGLSIPWSLVFATDLMQGGAAPEDLAGVPEIDELYNQWLREVTTDGTEVFGGDVDIDPEIKTSEETHSDEELLGSGPIGVHKWFSREELMTPLAAEGNTVIRFGDYFRASVRGIPAPSMGALNLFGVVRYAPDAQTNFNVELDDVTSKSMMGLLIAGDYNTVQAKIRNDSAGTGDFLRTVLFGGDSYVEADTLKGPAAKAFAKASIYIQSAISRFK